MGAETSFAAAEVELVVHATEDTQKVLSAVEKALGIKPERFEASRIEGHFGNEIKLLKANINGREATELAYTVARMLSDSDRAHMRDYFDLYLDDRNMLYVRISKQRLFEGRVVLSQADSLRIRFKPVKRFRPEHEVEAYRRFLEQG
jgi:RNA binding exosome subunit